MSALLALSVDFSTVIAEEQECCLYETPIARSVLSKTVRELCGADAVPADVQYRAAFELSDDLSPYEREACYEFMLHGEKPQGLLTGQYHMLIDAVMFRLRNQRIETPEFGDVLLNLYKDHSDPIICDYALQHFGLWCARQPSNDVWVTELNKATNDTRESLAGTALLALGRLCRENAGVSPKLLEEAVCNVLNNRNLSSGSILTALAVGRRNEIQGSVGSALNILCTHISDPVSKSSLKLIEQLANTENLEILEAVALKNNAVGQQLKPIIANLKMSS
jgi:hypothetical protein